MGATHTHPLYSNTPTHTSSVEATPATECTLQGLGRCSGLLSAPSPPHRPTDRTGW